MTREVSRGPMAERRSIWTPLGLALLCGHCALGGLVALLGLLGVATVPVVLGVSLNWIWPPVALLGLFGWLVWGGGAAADGAACPRR
jgi:hypothetical protein